MVKNNMGTENNSCDGYGCGDEVKMTCKHGSLRHHILKKIIWIFIVIAAFCFGVQFGELRGMIKSYSYRGGMMGWNNIERNGWNDTNKVYGPTVKVDTTTKDTTIETKTSTPKQ